MWPFKKKIRTSPYVFVATPSVPLTPKRELSINTEMELHRVDVTVTFKNGDEVSYFVEEDMNDTYNDWYPITRLNNTYYLVQKIKYCLEAKETFHFNQMKEQPSVNFSDVREVVFSQPYIVKSDFMVEHHYDADQWEECNLTKEQK